MGSKLRLNPKEIKLINYGFQIEKFQNLLEGSHSEGAKAIFKARLSKLEECYLDVRIDLYKEELEEAFIVKMVENGHSKNTAVEMLGSRRFNDFCLEKCFNSLNKAINEK